MQSRSSSQVSSCAVEISVPGEPEVILRGHVWENPTTKLPREMMLVFVHQWGILGGSGRLMQGIARNSCILGFNSITFDLRGIGSSSGRGSWCNSTEMRDVAAVCNFVQNTYKKKVFLVGSSAGAPLSGACLDYSPNIIGVCFIGYTWGFWSSIVFGWAYNAIENSTKPKLFVVGDRDEFTSMSQYGYRMGTLKGSMNVMKLIKGKNHFEIEGPAYDKLVAEWVMEFIDNMESIGTSLGMGESSSGNGGKTVANAMVTTSQPV